MEKNENLTKQQIKNRKKKNAAKKKKETSEKTEDNVPNTNGTAANKEETVKEVNQTAQDDDNFEEELCWCIQQIEIGLRNQKATKDQVSKSEKLMAQLKSKKNPKPKKRMLMRSNFGNYRQNMNKEMKQQAASPVKMIEVDEKAMKKSVFFKKKASDLPPVQNVDNNYGFSFNFSNPIAK